MSNQESKAPEEESAGAGAKVHDLGRAMERVKDRKASQDDVVVDMKQAERARLELLARELQPVFDDLPADNDQFEFALTSGEPPRLWIDATSFVRMGNDRRQYEFVKDTRLGRTMLYRSENKDRMGEVVTEYVAERVLERERAVEGEWLSLKGYDFDGDQAGDGSRPADDGKAHARKGWGVMAVILWFLVGILAGAAGMVAWAWFGIFPAI